MVNATASVRIPIAATAAWIAERLDSIIAERRVAHADEMTDYRRGFLDGLETAAKAMRAEVPDA